MRAIIAILIVILLSSSTLYASEGTVRIQDGFLTGQHYIGLSQSEQTYIAMGIIDGFLLAPFFGAPKERMKWFESLLENMTNVQVAAILSKYLEDNPGSWHYPLHLLMYNAIWEIHNKSRSTE